MELNSVTQLGASESRSLGRAIMLRIPRKFCQWKVCPESTDGRFTDHRYACLSDQIHACSCPVHGTDLCFPLQRRGHRRGGLSVCTLEVDSVPQLSAVVFHSLCLLITEGNSLVLAGRRMIALAESFSRNQISPSLPPSSPGGNGRPRQRQQPPATRNCRADRGAKAGKASWPAMMLSPGLQERRGGARYMSKRSSDQQSGGAASRSAGLVASTLVCTVMQESSRAFQARSSQFLPKMLPGLFSPVCRQASSPPSSFGLASSEVGFRYRCKCWSSHRLVTCVVSDTAMDRRARLCCSSWYVVERQQQSVSIFSCFLHGLGSLTARDAADCRSAEYPRRHPRPPACPLELSWCRYIWYVPTCFHNDVTGRDRVDLCCPQSCCKSLLENHATEQILERLRSWRLLASC